MVNQNRPEVVRWSVFSINLPKGDLDDPKGISRDVSEIWHYGNGDYDLKVKEDTDLDYIMFLINQSYKRQE